MKSVLVDERDTSWEDDHPVFRVFLVEPVHGATAAFDVSGARIDQVLAWAKENAAGRDISMAVVVEERDNKGLIRVYGTS